MTLPPSTGCALGTQSVSVWKDARQLGTAAGEAAMALAQGATLADIEGTVQFDADGTSMTSIFLEPSPSPRRTLTWWWTQDGLRSRCCAKVSKPASVAACA